MNILFLSLSEVDSLESKGIYTDLARELIRNGHTLFFVCATERRTRQKTALYVQGNNANLLKVKTFNITKTNVFEKGIAMLAIKGQFVRAIKKFCKDTIFDLIVYSTPPITLYGVVRHFKRLYGAKTYLMLKDIFPQNAVDLGILKTSGFKGIIFKYFRRKERKLYSISDRIGCMSPANVDYIASHNPNISKGKIEMFPNSIEAQPIDLSVEEKKKIRNHYGLPLDKRVFVYGGNLGKPQGIPFIIECLKAERNNSDVFFLIVGDGTEYEKLDSYSRESAQDNFKLYNRLPSSEFDRLIASCDVGLIFLDHRFTIPNFPSRLLSYMQAGLPVLACTDTNTDIGQVIVKGGFGWWCSSSSVVDFSNTIKLIADEKEKSLKDRGSLGRRVIEEEYSVKANFEKLLVDVKGK